MMVWLPLSRVEPLSSLLAVMVTPGLMGRGRVAVVLWWMRHAPYTLKSSFFTPRRYANLHCCR